MTDLAIEILKQIRDGVAVVADRVERVEGTLAERIDGLGQRIGQTNEGLDRLEMRVGRVEEGLLDLGQFMREFALAQAEHERFHRHHVELLEKDVADMRRRLEALEKRSA